MREGARALLIWGMACKNAHCPASPWVFFPSAMAHRSAVNALHSSAGLIHDHALCLLQLLSNSFCPLLLQLL